MKATKFLILALLLPLCARGQGLVRGIPTDPTFNSVTTLTLSGGASNLNLTYGGSYLRLQPDGNALFYGGTLYVNSATSFGQDRASITTNGWAAFSNGYGLSFGPNAYYQTQDVTLLHDTAAGTLKVAGAGGTGSGSLSLGNLTASGTVMAPTITLSGSAKISGPFVQLPAGNAAKTSAYTILPTDGDVEADASAGTFALTLHTTTGNSSVVHNLSNVGTANNVTVILTNGSFTTGATTINISPGSNLQVKVNAAGTKWIIL